MTKLQTLKNLGRTFRETGHEDLNEKIVFHKDLKNTARKWIEKWEYLLAMANVKMLSEKQENIMLRLFIISLNEKIDAFRKFFNLEGQDD